jgi:hypothetical protein
MEPHQMDERESAVRDRLSERQDAMAEAHQKRVRDTEEQQTEEENVELFVSTFKAQHAAIKKSLEASPSPDAAALNSIASQIADLQTFVNAHSLFLPHFELRRAQEHIAELEGLTSKVREATQPKKKFSFGASKVVKSTAGGSSNAAPAASTEQSAALRKAMEHKAIYINDLTGITRTVLESETLGSDVFVQRCTDVVLHMKCSPGALHISDLERCTIYCGPIRSAFFVDNCKDCVFIVACHQARIHRTVRTSFYLHCGSNPIIEDCSELGFAPYNLEYEGLDQSMKVAGFSADKNHWDKVDDFKWLKTQHSPNWHMIAEGERKPTIRI